MTDPIRVLHLINTLEMGGAEKRLCEIIEHLSGKDFQFQVTCLTRSGFYEQRVRDAGASIDELGYRALRVNGRLQARNLLQPLLAMRRFQQVVRRVQPDVVQTWIPICNFIGGRALAPWRFRHVALIASRVFTGEYKDANPLIPIVEAFGSRRADFVYCNSEAVRQDVLSREVTLEPSFIRVIRNGVDTERFHPAHDKTAVRKQLALPEEARIVLSIGALRAHKRHDVLLQAAEKTVQSTPDALFIFVGADQGQGEKLKALSRELKIEDHVLFAGPQGNVVPWLQASDLFALSSGEEGLPNVLLEAQACGIPCVATRLAGCEEAIAENETGLLVPPESPEEMSAAILRLLNDDGLRMSMGNKARTQAISRFSSTDMFQAFANLYREAAELRK